MRFQPALKYLPAVLAICLAASLPYVSTAANYFVNDDFGVVQLLSQKPPLYFPRWFVTSWMDNIWGAPQDEIRPFPAVTYQLAAAWGATSPLANHVTNIVFHAANALLVLAIARVVVGMSFIAATFAALVFALLPLHAESVAWITGRVDTIPALFFLGSFLAYAQWRRAASTWLYVCSIVLFFCALFSKQNTIVMVATLFLYDLVAERRPIRASWSWLAPYVPFAALTVAYLLLRYVLFGEVAREGHLTADGLAVTRIFVGKHFQRMFFGGEVSRYPSGYIAAILLTAGAWFLMRASGAANLRQGPAMVLVLRPVLVAALPRSSRGRGLRIHPARLSGRGGMGDSSWSGISRHLARSPRSVPLRSSRRECGPPRLLYGQTAGGGGRVERQGTCFPDIGR